jgi:hypothetical protein
MISRCFFRRCRGLVEPFEIKPVAFDCSPAEFAGPNVEILRSLLPQNKIYSYGDSLPHK